MIFIHFSFPVFLKLFVVFVIKFLILSLIYFLYNLHVYVDYDNFLMVKSIFKIKYFFNYKIILLSILLDQLMVIIIQEMVQFSLKTKINNQINLFNTININLSTFFTCNHIK
jgi:hypothetical protein